MDKKKLEKIEAASQKVEEVREKEQMDIVDILLDENNTDPIVLVDDKGKKISFEQIAVIPYHEKLYCVLKPIDKIENIADDEAVVFVVNEEEGKEPTLMVETDEQTAINVFDEYYNLLDEQDAKRKESKAKKSSKK